MSRIASLNTIKTMSRAAFEEACVAHVDHLYLGDHTVMCKVLTRYKMYVDTNDYSTAPHLVMDGYWESWITYQLAKLVEPGMNCLDIGANFGYFSLLLSGLTGRGRTISVEANPHICRFLKATASVNGHPFELVEAALSDRKGEAVLTVTEHEYGGGTIKPNELIAGRSQVRVPTISVDELLEEKGMGTLDVIKMDVEGVEPLVFSGMNDTLKKNPSLKIIMEYTPSIYENPVEFTEFLFDRFTIQHINDYNSLVPLGMKDRERLLQQQHHIDLYLQQKK